MDQIKEQQYAESIRQQYAPKSESVTKLEQLKRLDAKVHRPAAVFAYIFGIIGALVLGAGMCLAMRIIGDLMPLGIVVGVIGIAMVTVNYFIYKAILKSRKRKYADQVMSLSDELLNR